MPPGCGTALPLPSTMWGKRPRRLRPRGTFADKCDPSCGAFYATTPRGRGPGSPGPSFDIERQLARLVPSDSLEVYFQVLTRHRMRTRARVVISGIGVVAPNGIGKRAFWDALVAGTSGIDWISSFDPDP